jgi:hypothetical protein
MSRTRLIRPEFFSDETLATVGDATRLFYVGLWTLCDDAGYFDLKPRQIAAVLYPFRGQAARQRLTDKALAELESLGRVRVLTCGIHATIPTLPGHSIKGGTKAETYFRRHRNDCMSVRVRTSTDKSLSVSVSESVSDSDSAGEKPRSLRDVSKDIGGFAAHLASRKPA